ncbi:MAG: hypothetical protein R6U22_12500 [Desulfohalobiaceae bacterium]
MKIKFWIAPFLLLALVCSCSPNVVSLQYQPQQEFGPECEDKVTVLPFQDTTGKRNLGTNRKGEQIFSDIAVEKWVREATADQLEAQGCKVRVSGSADAGVAVEGRILDVDLQEVSSTEYKGALRVEIMLRAEPEGKDLYRETFGVKVGKHILPGTKRVEDVLQELMQELMQAMVPKLVQRMQEED